jgi:cytochrome c
MDLMRRAGLLALLIGLIAAGTRANDLRGPDLRGPDLRGHGGPVRAIIVTPETITTAGFDTTIIRWDSARGTARQVLRFHDGAVNALAVLPDGGLASAGEDRRIALWRAGASEPYRVLEGHAGPVAGLSLSPDGLHLASASWDGTVRVWTLATGQSRVLDTHRGPVNAVLYLPDGRIATAGHEGKLRIFSQSGAPSMLDLGLPLNALALAGDELAVAGADGKLRFFGPDLQPAGEIEIAEVPIVALAASADGARVAAAGFRGALVIIEQANRRIERKLIGPAFPLWSLAFSADGKEILTGGADRLVRRWSVATGEPVSALVREATEAKLGTFEGHRGAEVFKACIACHTLSADDGNRAGPTLHGIMGRRIASAAGYAFSPALAKLDIIWSKETVAKLFEVGPMTYTPGTKMPEQTIGSAEDRAALVDFLDKATR